MTFLEVYAYLGWFVFVAVVLRRAWRNRRTVVPVEYLQDDITRARIRRASRDVGE